MTARWDARRLLARRFRTRPAASILVALLTLLTVAIAAVVPRLVEQQRTAELSFQLQSIGATGRSLQGVSNFPENWGSERPELEQIYGDLQGAFDSARQELDQPLRGLVGKPQWLVQTDALSTATLSGAIPLLGVRLTADPVWTSRITFVDGSAPRTWSKTDDTAPEQTRTTPVDIALSVEAARQLKIAVGDVITADVDHGIPNRLYRVSGLFEPRHAADQFWQQNPSILPVTTSVTPRGDAYPTVAAYVAPVSVGRLANTFGGARVSLYYPVSATGVDGADAERLVTELSALGSTGIHIPSGGPAMQIATGSDDAVQAAIDRVGLLASLLALLAAAPLGLVFAVLVLGVQVVVRARRTDLVLAAARGGSWLQLRGAMALEGALLSVPAAIVVTALATVLIPVRTEASGFVLPALVALILPTLFAVLAVTRERPGALGSIAGQLRGAVEIGVIALAGLSLFLLARRGLAQAAASVGVDPLLSVAPLLLAISVGILVLRGYPIPMRAARRAATRGRGLAAFVGAIRATRAPTIGLAGVLALVVGISVALFSTVLLSTFDAGITKASQRSVGADARVDAAALTPAQRSAVAAVTGVRDVAGIQYLTSNAVTHAPSVPLVTVLLAQTHQLASLRHLPSGLATEANGRVPVVVSSDLFEAFGSQRTATIDGVDVQVVGSLPADSQLGIDHDWVIIDSSFASRLQTTFAPGTLLIHADPQRLPTMLHSLEHAVGADAIGATSTVTTVPHEIADRSGEPVVVGVRSGLLMGALLSVLLCALALVLATVAAGASRGRTAGILRTLGMPRRRLGSLIAWELVPVAVVALAAGAALGIALPFVVTSAVDLRPFTGGVDPAVPVLDPLLLCGVLAVFSLVVVVSGLVAIAVGNRVNPSATLKMGAS